MSNYGPKQYKLYSFENNLKRKSNRTGDLVEGIGQNEAVKAYSTKPGQLSSKAQAAQEQRKVRRLSGPVKTYTSEEIQQLNKQLKAS